MKVYKFFPPYKANGKTQFPHTQKRAGVYLIRENSKIVYVGRSATNLYKTMYRHFQQWTHRGQDVTTYVNKMNRNRYTVRVILCTPAQAERLEKALIIKHKPRDNREKYKQYTLKFDDKKEVANYENTIVTMEAPF